MAEDVVRDLDLEPLAIVAGEPLLLTELVANVAQDALAHRVRVHLRVEELGPEATDHGEVDAVLELGEGVAPVRLGRDRPGARDPLVQVH